MVSKGFGPEPAVHLDVVYILRPSACMNSDLHDGLPPVFYTAGVKRGEPPFVC